MTQLIENCEKTTSQTECSRFNRLSLAKRQKSSKRGFTPKKSLEKSRFFWKVKQSVNLRKNSGFERTVSLIATEKSEKTNGFSELNLPIGGKSP
ncbi:MULTISPECIES: hypothetical protein [Cyanophyceae]|uniref:hypothetical protein n=1 Tax=Cyanophyceae TaxID=3028117 RepID=UPI0016879FC8|nr:MULTISPECIES: hypothetical protein [Cyanophyceae]MBD1915909.1 hypothetical protein [Phormidium sp. FACHB-77]MBD2030417.1 hypothetical protein [Phormidium sp. FACHB-322]MBD2053419.1 hypothetical protein [Leptolyngbya sp. FACHB-60]